MPAAKVYVPAVWKLHHACRGLEFEISGAILTADVVSRIVQHLDWNAARHLASHSVESNGTWRASKYSQAEGLLKANPQGAK